jgi:hypothetical protein
MGAAQWALRSPFEIAGDRIKHIWAVRNPQKLRPWSTG